MSTQPHSEHVDLDRTDELPRLDVEAYEAQLAAQAGDTLASTDAWSVQSLRDAEAEEAEQDFAAVRFPRTRAQIAEPQKTDVTLDANRILGRIQQLESELEAAGEREARLQARIGELSTDLAAKEKDTRGLSTDNARLTEQRSTAIERVRALEQQLKDDAAHYERELTQQRELRAAEQQAATTARVALEAQVTDLSTIATRLRDANVRLDDDASAARKLAKTHMELIEQFKQRLANEEKNSAQLARHLAAKIAEHAATDHEIARRDATIQALSESRDDLAARLEASRVGREELSSKLDDSTRRNVAIEATLRERDASLAERDTRIEELVHEARIAQESIASLATERDTLSDTLAAERESQAQAQQALSARAHEIDALHGSTEQLQARITQLQQQLAAEQSAHGEKSGRLQDLERALSESQLRRDMLTSEVESTRARVQHLETEAKQGVAAREALTAKTDEVQHFQEALALARRELDGVRTNLVTKHSEVTEREHALRAAQEIVADLRKINAGLEQKIEGTRLRLEELETRDREREEGVLANAADLAAARRQLGQQLTAVQSMEQAIRARDTLTERLRAELQVSQDERAIMAGQLEKSRARNKSMAREIFARDNQIATLKADLAVHAETLAAIRQDVNRATTAAEGEHPDRILEPVDHDADIIVLNKKMMTIGRTIDSDICIPSKLVSRNHARLLIGPNAVILEDAGSTNGCLVNDVPVKQQLMREGDVVAIGDLKYRLRTRGDNTRVRDNVISMERRTQSLPPLGED